MKRLRYLAAAWAALVVMVWAVIVLGGVAFVLIATFLIAGTSNAVNLTDGMDGLAAGSLAVASFALMVLCFIAGSFDTARFLLFPHIDGSKELMIVNDGYFDCSTHGIWPISRLKIVHIFRLIIEYKHL